MLVPGIPTGDLVAIASGPNYVGIGQNLETVKAGLASAHAMIPSRFPGESTGTLGTRACFPSSCMLL